jgi:hypothetical protein
MEKESVLSLNVSEDSQIKNQKKIYFNDFERVSNNDMLIENKSVSIQKEV